VVPGQGHRQEFAPWLAFIDEPMIDFCVGMSVRSITLTVWFANASKLGHERNACHGRKTRQSYRVIWEDSKTLHNQVPRLIFLLDCREIRVEGGWKAGRKPGFTLSIDRTFRFVAGAWVPGRGPNRRKFEVLNQRHQSHFRGIG